MGWNTELPWGLAGGLAGAALVLFPRLAEVSVIRTYQGFRPATPDHLPLIGPDARVSGLYHATGHEGAGIGLALGTAEVLADAVLDGAVDRDFAPDRFGEQLPADANLRTSVDRVVAAGEITGVGGAEKAAAEGRLAGLTLAADLGHGPVPAERALRRRIARHQAFARHLAAIYPFDHGWADRITDDVPVCRCEEVSAGAIRATIAAGAHDARSIKGVARPGMGYCQGAVCGPLVRSLLISGGHARTGDLESGPLAAPVTLGELRRLA